ncbi:hypothetical protein DV738_g4174, partial [Chaetothyriales sp. CBS 135597]
METSCNDNYVSKLSETLRDAVSHSQALFTQLEDQTRTIESLRRVNDELRREIEQLKNATPDITAQLDHFFQQDAAKQAKIESLEANLRLAERERDQARALLANATSADDRGGVPQSLPGKNTSTSVSLENPLLPSTKPARDGTSVSAPVSKRRRVEADDRLFGVLTDNALNTRRPWKDRARDKSSPGAQAIVAVTEDGQDHNCSDENETPDPDPSEIRRGSGLHSRLDTLLSAARPSHPPLSRTHAPAKALDPRPPEQKPPSGSHSTRATGSVLKPDRSSNLRFLHPGRDRSTARKNQHPLRGRPLNQLNLSHFRLNPRYTGYGTEKHTHGTGCNRSECCGNTMRAIAMSLAPDSHIAEDDLLLDFLGPGSEQKVATLTAVARENLLHEARVKRAAREYGRLHKTSRERAPSPAGFWTTDMPSPNEKPKICEDARQWERLEVENRYHEAQTGQGKWVFADEAAA